jgi:hypothetical protein
MTKSIIAMAAVAATVAVALTTSAGAQSGSRTLALTAVEQRCDHNNAGSKYGGLGHLDVCRGTLRDSTGATAGRAHWTCTYLGSTRRGSDCTAHVKLKGGSIEAAGWLSHTSPQSDWAITGGTGGYAGARGTIHLRQLGDTRTSATLTLLP